jgi:hypothetical protein
MSAERKAGVQDTGAGAPASGREVVRRIVASTRPEDYDGHTEFRRLDARARLEWLDLAVCFVESQGGRVDVVAEDPP